MILIRVAVALGLMLGLSISVAAQGSSTLYMPILLSSDTMDTGLAFSNPTLTATTLTLTARTYAGAVITGEGITNPKTLNLPASNQLARRPSEIFGAGIQDRTGWVEVRTGNPSVRGFFAMFDPSLSQMDGAEFQKGAFSRVIFPRISTLPGSITDVTYVNTSAQSTGALFTVYTNSGQIVSQQSLPVGPYSGFSGPVTGLLPSGTTPFEGFAVLESMLFGPSSLIGFESYRTFGDVAIMTAVPEANQFRAGYVPLLATQGGYRTRVVLVNYMPVIQSVTVTAENLTTSAGAYAPSSLSVTRPIPAFGRIEENVDQMFGLSGGAVITGNIRWTTEGITNGPVGYVEIGTTDGILLSAVPAQGTAYSDLFFSQIADGAGYYTGIALLNPNSSSSNVAIEAFNLQGQSVGRTVVTLLAGERRSRLLTELFQGYTGQFGGYIRVSATRPIYAVQLFGSQSLTFLANVPAQGVAIDYQDSGTSVDSDTGAVVLSQDTTISLLIPAGALSSDTTISVQSVTTPNPSASQTTVAAVRALPAGTNFLIPVCLVFPLAAQLKPGAKIDVLIYDAATGQFTDSGFDATVDEFGRTATVYITHFTDYVAAIPSADTIAVSGLNPASGAVGTTVVISGSGFSPDASQNIVTFAGASSPTVQATVLAALPTELTVTVPAGAVTGNVIVQVGDKTSAGVLFTIPVDKPAPVLNSISPSSVVVGVASQTLQLTGTGFHPTSQARLAGLPVPTTVVDSTRILASLSGEIQNAGVYAVTVFSPAPGGGESVARDFTVMYPAPTITGTSPQTANAGPNPVVVTISGTGFLSSSRVLIDGVEQSATFVNSTTLQVTLTSGSAGTQLIAVSNPAPGGGFSNSAAFTFTTPPIASIVLISQSATSAAVGAGVQFIVELRNAGGQPFAGGTAAFAIASGGGSVPGPSATSDALGRIAITLTLGTVPGLNRVGVTAGSASLNVDVTGIAGAPSRLTLSASPGSFVAGSAGSTVSARIEDQFGNLIDTTGTVNFAVTSGTGTLSAPSAIAVAGVASVVLTSTTKGTITVQGTSGLLTAGNVNVTVNAADAVNLTYVSGNGQTAVTSTQLPNALVVRVTDTFGNVVNTGVTVTFAAASGGGSVNPNTAQTPDSSGQASALATVGPDAGINQFTATSTPPLAGSPLIFSASGSASLGPANLIKIEGDIPVQVVTPGLSLLTALKVKVTNSGSVALANVTVDWAAATGGGSVSAPTSITDVNGEATILATVGSSAGANTFTATVAGLPAVTFNATAANLAITGGVTVNLASGATVIGAYQVTISFDKDLVTLASANVTGGSGVGFTGTPITVNIDNAAGTVTVNHFQVGSSPAGDFNVATLVFTPIRKGTGTATLAPSGITVTDAMANDVSTGFLSLSNTSLTIN